MHICSSIEEFIKFYFDKYGKYSFKNLDFDDKSKWKELFDYCIKNCDDDIELFSIISSFYYFGIYVDQNYELAAEYSEIGAKKGSINCLWQLGLLYSKGYFYDQSYEMAFAFYLKAAKLGCIPCMYNVGLYYAIGQGVAQSYEEAVKWYRMAAEQGDSDAQYTMGLYYAKGQGVEQSYEEAIKWYMLAAKQGNSSAQLSVALFYDNDQLYEDAAKWYKLAAEQGEIIAQKNLGYYYVRGLGVEQSYEEAIKWYMLAAKQGDSSAQLSVALFYDSSQLYEDAVKWYKLAAEQGEVVAQYNLALLYEEGLGVTQSYKEAAKWYLLAAKQRKTAAQSKLGLYYESGLGVEQSYEEAVKWYKLAADQGDEYAQIAIGNFHFEGICLKKSYEEAVKWYMLAAEQGNPIAQNNLGSCFLEGFGVEQSYEEAVKWYKLAAEQGEAVAQFNLARCFLDGFGVEQSYEEAVKWYMLAAEQGDPSAQNNLAHCYLEGLGVEQSYEEALKWFKLSAIKNNPYAFINLANMYNDGKGVFQDYKQALEYAQKAYNLGLEEAKDFVEELKEKVNFLAESNVISYGNLKLGNRKDVFISWNHHDKEIKDNLVFKLNELGFNSCFDSDGDGHGELLPILKAAISDSKASIILVTKYSILSNWVKQEVEEMLKKASIDPVYKESIKPILISDSDGDIVDLINNIEDEESPFKKLLCLCGQFEYDGYNINIMNVKSFLIQAIDKTLKLQYKYKVLDAFKSFSTALKNTYNSQNTTTGIISSMVDFDGGYIERNVYKNKESYTLEDIIKIDSPILIYGEGGCGKSLYLKNFSRKVFEAENFVFYLESKKLTNDLESNESFLSIIKRNSFNNYYPDYHEFVTIESFENIFINRNNIYILIDALDEINFEQRNKLFETIQLFKDKYSNIHFIFTSRNVSDSVDIGKIFSLECKCFELVGLTDEEVEKLYNNIFKNYNKKNSNSNLLSNYEKNPKDFISKIIEIDDEIKRNPLLLSNLIFIYLLSNSFPNTKYEIIDKTVEIMITDIEEDRGITFKYKDFLNKENLTKLLSELAYFRAANDNSSIIEIFKEVITEIDSNLDSKTMAYEIYKYLKNRAIITDSGLSHEIFKDYFAATSLYDDIYEIGKIKKKRRIIFKESGYQNLLDYDEDFMNENEPWPGITCNFITKLDFNIKKTNDNENNDAFAKTINHLICEGNMSKKANEILKYLVERKSLFFNDFLKQAINLKM